jgi:hypothetical protein
MAISDLGAKPATPSRKGVFMPARDHPLYSVLAAGFLRSEKTKKKGVLKGVVTRSGAVWPAFQARL